MEEIATDNSLGKLSQNVNFDQHEILRNFSDVLPFKRAF